MGEFRDFQSFIRLIYNIVAEMEVNFSDFSN